MQTISSNLRPHLLRNVARQSCQRWSSRAHPGRSSHVPPNSFTASGIMKMSANKATRFVYLRTLPLVKQAELDGQVDEVASSIEEMTRNICEKYAETVPDDRTAVHLHTASLAIATHRVLSSQIRNQIRLSNIIRAGFGATLINDPSSIDQEGSSEGAERKRPDFWIVRAALWFSFDRMAAVRKMTANMVRDFGSQFETETRDSIKDTKPKHELFVINIEPQLRSSNYNVCLMTSICPSCKEKCYYNTLCRQEGLPHLTRVFCALDRAIFSPITERSHGIEFTLEHTLADESSDVDVDQSCHFKFTKKA